MDEHDTHQPEEVDPPDWAVTETGIPSGQIEGLEEYIATAEPTIAVSAASEAARPERAPAADVATEAIVDRIGRFIERFVFLKTKSTYKLLALWVVATHMYSDFEYMGYIFACSPEPQSGKSRLLEILDLLVGHSSGILVSPSLAVLFRTADAHTQLFDEVDGWTNGEYLRSVLNAGFHRGATVMRAEEGGGGYNVKQFQVFAPRALAGIGNKILNATTRDRTFLLEMVRQTPTERREKFRVRNAKPEAEQIKSEITTWVEKNRRRVTSFLARADFPYLQGFRDRTIDITEPLAAILETAYAKRPGLAEARAELLDAIAVTRKDQASLTDDHRILETLAKLAKSEDPLVGNPTELAARCGQELGENPDSLDVSSILRRYGFEPKSIRKDGADPKKRYSLPFSALDELLKRYGSPEKPSEYVEAMAVVGVVSQETAQGGGL